MNDLPLADLDAFAAVARERSFRTAARKRGVSASALSEALRRLEAKLGVRLLNRTTRSVTPTEAGKRLLERLTPALGEIAGALDQVASERDSPAGTLRLNVPTIVARVILPPLVGRFMKAHPAITLERGDAKSGDFRAMSPRFQEGNVERNLALVEALRRIADAKGVTVAQIAIAWVAAQGEDIVPLIGARRRDRLAEALGSQAVDLDAGDISAIESAVPKNAAAGARYPEAQLVHMDSERQK
ncbi:DNA-binding MarR family transcriptional regulator [Sinorhizobium medicae]